LYLSYSLTKRAAATTLFLFFFRKRCLLGLLSLPGLLGLLSGLLSLLSGLLSLLSGLQGC
jgi:hypothetical protein